MRIEYKIQKLINEDYIEEVIRLRKENLKYSKIAELLGISIDKVRYICKKNSIKKAKKEYPCKICKKDTGSYNKKYCSDKCRTGLSDNDIDTIKYLRERCYTSKEIADKLNTTSKRIEHFVYKYGIEKAKKEYPCRICGKDTGSPSRRFCSNKCKKDFIKITTDIQILKLKQELELKGKSNKSIKREIRRYRILTNGERDYGITLEKLYNKYDGVCYICGKKCDYNDYINNEDGYFIAGERYPSIDHIIPLAKCGTHTWDNIQLAHRGCNAIKNDRCIEE